MHLEKLNLILQLVINLLFTFEAWMDGKDIGHEIEYNCTGMLIDSFNFGNPEKVEEAGPLEIIYRVIKRISYLVDTSESH